MTAIVKPLTSNFTPAQVPHFVAESYPVFVQFMQAYYTWLDSYVPRDLENEQNVDDSLSGFLSHYNAELNYLSGIFAGLTPQQFIEISKQFYLSKGSAASYQLLFNLLYNESVSLTYPSSQIFKLSDSQWIQDRSIFVNITVGNAFNLIGQTVTIQVGSNSYVVLVSAVSVVNGTIYELSLDASARNVPMNCVGYIVTSLVGVSGTVVGVVNPFASTIYQAGNGFSVGQTYNVQPVGSTSSTTIKITSVTSGGGIGSFEIIKFGSGYTAPFNVVIVPTTNSTKATTTVYNPYVDNLGNFSESGYILTSNYWIVNQSNTAVQYGSADYVGQVISSFSSTENTGLASTTTPTNLAIVSFGIGGVANYPGYYQTANSLLDNPASVLQDSLYYQQFSYLIKSTHPLSDFEQYVKNYLHPAGTKVFSEYGIETVSPFNNSPPPIVQTITTYP